MVYKVLIEKLTSQLNHWIEIRVVALSCIINDDNSHYFTSSLQVHCFSHTVVFNNWPNELPAYP